MKAAGKETRKAGNSVAPLVADLVVPKAEQRAAALVAQMAEPMEPTLVAEKVAPKGATLEQSSADLTADCLAGNSAAQMVESSAVY